MAAVHQAAQNVAPTKCQRPFPDWLSLRFHELFKTRFPMRVAKIDPCVETQVRGVMFDASVFPTRARNGTIPAADVAPTRGAREQFAGASYPTQVASTSAAKGKDEFISRWQIRVAAGRLQSRDRIIMIRRRGLLHGRSRT